MGDDGSIIRLIYIEDEQPLVFPQIAKKKRMCPMRECAPLSPTYLHVHIRYRYSVFTINVPLAVRFATVAIGMCKAESPEYGRFDRDLH